MDVTTRQAALWFASKGHPVLPIHSIREDGTCTCGDKCVERDDKGIIVKATTRGKHPHHLAPRGLNDAALDAAIVRTWFDEHYWLNYGVRCDEILVVDIDPRHGGHDKWAEIANVPTRAVPHTWEVRTGRYDGKYGRHLYFRNPGIAKGVLDKGVEVQGKGGYVLGPCSLHHRRAL
jgi:hypothetical protein